MPHSLHFSNVPLMFLHSVPLHLLSPSLLWGVLSSRKPSLHPNSLLFKVISYPRLRSFLGYETSVFKPGQLVTLFSSPVRVSFSVQHMHALGAQFLCCMAGCGVWGIGWDKHERPGFWHGSLGSNGDALYWRGHRERVWGGVVAKGYMLVCGHAEFVVPMLLDQVEKAVWRRLLNILVWREL